MAVVLAIPSPIDLDGSFIHDGVKLRLTFRSEFSNVLLIQVNVTYPPTVTDLHITLSASGAKQANYHVTDIQNQGIGSMSSDRSMSSSASSSGSSSLSSNVGFSHTSGLVDFE